MTVEEMQAQLDKMKDDIAHMEAKVSECERMISIIKAQDEPKFERMSKCKMYFFVGSADAKARADTSCEYYDEIDNARFDNNNYFKTCERAQEVADKINLLLKLERLHDTFCSDSGGRYYITYIPESEKYYYGCLIRNASITFPASVMFPSEEIAKKVCDILNKERENND